ncbi:Methyltransferase domain-containing protein [Paucidesulfovibrio gracilis DSM 16080]|uniref:Methyltransferase domain-containing protein n=1 Tax=Paucidesulfovibrio gracilis DSM 16080 TaxID=1121449 RepID=A0A1T4WA68_9BACT|nr:methyltransferase domain-containing protein [Paucidesulfovibrio gracilis]SKA73928.1 Methyltransferase domain-containing protein [Paucidesulfovibrio gracilis DSM 16080]
MDRAEIEREIERLSPWPRLVQLADKLYTIPQQEWNKHSNAISHQHFVTQLLRDVFDDFDITPDEKTLLDYGCNCGWLSMSLRRFGFEHVTGVDVSERWIEQANFLASACKLDRLHFIHGGEEVLDTVPQVDITCCLGVLNHTCSPVLLLEKLREKTKTKLILDCNCLVKENSVEVEEGANDAGTIAAHFRKGRGLVFDYSKQAVRNLLLSAGFETVYERVLPVSLPRKGYYIRRVFFVANCDTKTNSSDALQLDILYNDIGPGSYVQDATFPIEKCIPRKNTMVDTRNVQLSTQPEHLRKAYLDFMKRNPDKRFYIWGTGSLYTSLQEIFPRDRILAFIENDTSKVGHKIEGIPVVTPIEASRMGGEAILVASHAKKKILKQIPYVFQGKVQIP